MQSLWPKIDRSPSAVFDGVRREVFAVRSAAVDQFKHDPVALMEAAGYHPDLWQRNVLQSRATRMLLLCTRQGGKSTVTASKALHTALYKPRSLTLLLSPSLRQSQELFEKVMHVYHTTGAQVPSDLASALRIKLSNGSRIIALPGNEKTIRGYSGVDLLVIDEASRVDDELYFSVRPMLAVSGGQLMALTTPFGKRGFFFREWIEGGSDWERISITADDCPRITPEFLEEERRRLGPTWYRQEYFCEFMDTVDSVFHYDDIQRAFTDSFTPFLEEDDDGVLTDDFQPFTV